MTLKSSCQLDRYDGLVNLAQDFVDTSSEEEIALYHQLYVLLYADDTVILSQSAEGLQSALSALYDYCGLWELTVNASKTKVMIFGSREGFQHPAFVYGHTNIEVVKEHT